ncbi:MAG: helix-turn-helix transcriptional regulator, partial [Planctomycetaceae bacterium]
RANCPVGIACGPATTGFNSPSKEKPSPSRESDIETALMTDTKTSVAQTIELEGKTWVIVERSEYERLRKQAGVDDDLPPLPEADRRGNFPALEYARASLARKILRRRRLVGLSQADLARQAGVRVETLNRIEKGRTTPNVATVDKIDAALRKAEASA